LLIIALCIAAKCEKYKKHDSPMIRGGGRSYVYMYVNSMPPSFRVREERVKAAMLSHGIYTVSSQLVSSCKTACPAIVRTTSE
jgi:hypothetical protein